MKASPQLSSEVRMEQAAFMGTLLLLLVTLPGAVRGGTPALPRLSNVSHILNVKRCQLDVAWTPVKMEGTSSVIYESGLNTSGGWVQVEFLPAPSRTIQVPLGKEVVFRVRTSSGKDNNSVDGEWVNIPLPQNDAPGTGAINVSCVWHNMKYLGCSWLRGEKASHNATYNLTAWVPSEGIEQPCTNYTKEGDAFRCAVDLKFGILKPLSISIQGNSSDVQPVCILSQVGKGEFPVKLDPPSIVNITKSNGSVSLSWTEPLRWTSIYYEVEINNSGSQIWTANNPTISIRIKPKVRHTFRVRAKYNTNEEIWTSDWSKEEEWDERDHMFSILYIFLPLCVAILTVVFLVYRKRIKELILPTIPEPKNLLGRMFDGESEDHLKVKSLPEDPKSS